MLKQKVGGTIQEVILPDFPDDDTTFTTTVTKSRRVSFGPNFVKEFIADSAVSAQCMTEYEQPFPSSDSSSADSSHSVQSTFVVHDSAKAQIEVNESRFKQSKFASTICFSSDSPTADMEFTEGCITLAKSILDKKNKEMSVFIQAKSKEPKEEEKGKEEETNYFDGSQFEMSMTGCLRSKENKREERRLMSEKTRIFGRYENEMSLTRCERIMNDEEMDQSVEEETKEGRMLLDAIMRHLDKDSSDSDLFNPERSLKRLGVNPFELSDNLDLNESMEISEEVNRVGLTETQMEGSNRENLTSENLIPGTNGYEGSSEENGDDKVGEVDVANQTTGPMTATFDENEPPVDCCEKSCEAMEISSDIQQIASDEISSPGEAENSVDVLEEPAIQQQQCQENSFCAGSPPGMKVESLQNAENTPQSFLRQPSEAPPAVSGSVKESPVIDILENAQNTFQQSLSSAIELPGITESGNTALEKQLEVAAGLHNTQQSIHQDLYSEVQPSEEKVNETSALEFSEKREPFEEASIAMENSLPSGEQAADVSVGSSSPAQFQVDEPRINSSIEDMDISGSCQVPPGTTPNCVRARPISEQAPRNEPPRKLSLGEANKSEGIPFEEDDGSTEPVLGDLKVIENLKEQSKEPGCVWNLQDLRHPGKRTEGLLSFSCRLFESTASVQFTLKMSDEDSFYTCSTVTNSNILLDECKEWKLPEYNLVVGFGFEELKRHLEEHRQRVKKIRHVPYFLDQVNSFLSKINAYLRQIYSVLTLYPGSRLLGSRLSFRLFSFPIFFSCVVTIDLSNMFRLSKASLSLDHDFGSLNERTVEGIFEESLKKENSLCEFVVEMTRYLVELERRSGYLSKRGHIRLLPRELKQ